MVNCISQLVLLAHAGRIGRLPSLDTIEHAMKLSPLVVQALWDKQSPLMQLPHIEEDMLKHFHSRKRNIKNLQQLAKMKVRYYNELKSWCYKLVQSSKLLGTLFYPPSPRIAFWVGDAGIVMWCLHLTWPYCVALGQVLDHSATTAGLVYLLVNSIRTEDYGAFTDV